MKYIKTFENFNGFSKGELPLKFYHGTTREYLDSILSDGLNPENSKSAQDAVYLTDDVYTAENYCYMHDCSKEDWIILEIDTSYLDTDLLLPDDYELKDFLQELNDSEGTDYDSVYDVPWQLSLYYCSQIAYAGKIPVEAIQIKKAS